MELKLLYAFRAILNWLLLIAPYGIETIQKHMDMEVLQLLIAPYGIETAFIQQRNSGNPTTNRTLWN